MITKEVYLLPGGHGYGYRILINGKPVIQQIQAPAISGLHLMTERQANRLADMVVEKLKEKPNDLPFLPAESVHRVLMTPK